MADQMTALSRCFSFVKNKPKHFSLLSLAMVSLSGNHLNIEEQRQHHSSDTKGDSEEFCFVLFFPCCPSANKQETY